jgi:hypothetical protein
LVGGNPIVLMVNSFCFFGFFNRICMRVKGNRGASIQGGESELNNLFKVFLVSDDPLTKTTL